MDISSISSSIMTDFNDQLIENQDELQQTIQLQQDNAVNNIQASQLDAFSASTIQPCN